MKIAAFDIETIPNQNLPAGTIPQFDPKTVKHGKTIDPVKRQAKEAAERAKFNNGLNKKMSLHPDLCEVVCFVGMKYDTISGEHEDIVMSEDSNAVSEAWWFISDAYHTFVPIVSFNGSGFDLPVLLHRAMYLNIPVSKRIYNDLTKRYSIMFHYDLMQVLADWDKQRWESLNFYLQGFGIGKKTGHGGDVYKLWQAGRTEQIEAYCREDVLLTAKLFARLESWIVPGVSTDD